MGLWRKKRAEPDPDGPWTVVFALQRQVGKCMVQEWHWSGEYQTPSRDEAKAMAQRIQDRQARVKGDPQPWAYARVVDAEKLLRSVDSPEVVQWPSERWAEV